MKISTGSIVLCSLLVGGASVLWGVTRSPVGHESSPPAVATAPGTVTEAPVTLTTGLDLFAGVMANTNIKDPKARAAHLAQLRQTADQYDRYLAKNISTLGAAIARESAVTTAAAAPTPPPAGTTATAPGLVGRWVNTDKGVEIFEFTSQGTVIMNNQGVGVTNMRAKYDLIGTNQVRIHFDNFPVTFTYHVSGSQLTLTMNDGETAVYHRQS